MSIIFFAHSVFGIWFVVRIQRYFRGRGALSCSIVTKIGTIFVFIMPFAVFLMRDHPFFLWMACASLVVVSFLTLRWLELREIARLRSEIPQFLERWILNQKIGTSTFSARIRALESQSKNFQALSAPLWAQNSGEKRTKSHLLFNSDVIEELQYIEQQPHQSLSRLENLRSHLKRVSDFRRKSGQAMRQAQIQAIVLLSLQIALTIFTGHRFGWSRHIDLIALATGWSMIGVLVMYRLAKKKRWQI